MSTVSNPTRRSFVKAGLTAAAVATAAAAPTTLNAASALADDTKPDYDDPVETVSCDVVVVGTGTSGMVAAVQAVEQGLETVVIEKLSTIGGQSQAAEVMFGCNSRLQDELGLHYTDYELLTNECEFHNWHVDRELWSRIIEVSGESMNWLLDNIEPYGAGFATVLGGIGAPRVAHMFGTYSDEDGDWEKGAGVIHALNKVLLANGVEVRCEHEATKLISDGDKIVGVYALSPAGVVRIDSKATILGCGGFTGNSEMIDSLGRNSAHMMCRGYATNVGDGIRMCREVGADHRGAMCTQLMGPSMPFPDGNSNRYVNAAAVLMGYPLWVNQHGVRFVKEAGLVYTVTANAIDMQDEVFSVFDQARINAYADYETGEDLSTYFTPGTKLDRVQEEIESLLDEGADFVFKADTLEGLATQMGVPVDNFLANVARYNELCAAGADDDFGKDPELMSPVATGPFYACKVYANLLCTGGGVRVDKDARVLRTGSVPIDGLYCVGQDCDGFMGETYGVNLPGSTQGISLCTGRLAALHAAQYVR